ncbi:hypothetical protein [Marinomonas aquiplantarum]|uniref:Uncharacterized protein n=1 Tax=Marinomonas aquiplantarum TaxID=491951 RepID=A0A366CXR0_9GAMM|nr:hypothetical protein [Marinomonas aquiplantarum]RBO82603.1 hypothetical protein DFP76_10567 [Marinomonas aquiplantarum]
MRSATESRKMQFRHEAQAEKHFQIEAFGDAIAKRENYKAHKGLDAIHFYLVQKFHWTPATARHLSFDDLEFLLKEEKHGWEFIFEED